MRIDLEATPGILKMNELFVVIFRDERLPGSIPLPLRQTSRADRTPIVSWGSRKIPFRIRQRFRVTSDDTNDEAVRGRNCQLEALPGAA
jgi:hypothetical protein